MTVRFSSREVWDLVVAWAVLGLAFTVFFLGGGSRTFALLARGEIDLLTLAFVSSLLTAGVGFLLHELGHKVSAVRFGQIAEFRADYGMLFLALMSAAIGFLFAAPGAVHHRGHLTEREHGLIALAGPAVNLVLAAVFVPVALVGATLGSPLVTLVGSRGLAVNLFLAAFNLIPYGPLDGRTVMGWSMVVWAVVFVPSIVVTVVVVFVLGVGF